MAAEERDIGGAVRRFLSSAGIVRKSDGGLQAGLAAAGLDPRSKMVLGFPVAKRPIDPDELDESPSEEDLERFGDVTQTCPQCGTELYDDVDLCWNCGHALMSRPARPPAALIVVLIVVLLVIGLLVFGRLW
jgi:hypothetical protein